MRGQADHELLRPRTVRGTFHGSDRRGLDRSAGRPPRTRRRRRVTRDRGGARSTRLRADRTDRQLQRRHRDLRSNRTTSGKRRLPRILAAGHLHAGRARTGPAHRTNRRGRSGGEGQGIRRKRLGRVRRRTVRADRRKRAVQRGLLVRTIPAWSPWLPSD